ncbi:MAG: OmpA family protein [Acidobacteria bacterium]|nr:OmpA family protein [Acidobacteriota bacterium]
MINIKKYRTPVLVAAFVLILSTVYAQDNDIAAVDRNQADILKVPIGQKMEVEGVVIGHENDNLILRGSGGGLYNVAIAGAEIKEKKSNPFRGAKTYSRTDLVQGLQIEVKGAGDSLGSISAREIRFRADDFKLAQTMDARVVPVENRLKITQEQLSETEQNAQRLSGQVRELTAVTDIVRDSAKAAQNSADGAMVEAKSARSVADNAKVGVKTANERITSLDTYEIKNVATVNFKAGSAILSETVRAELDKFAENAKSEKGFLIEVIGFASSDGDEDFNRRLSKKRADAVVQYLAENYSIPIRRFIFPMGYGEKQPIADNSTLEGRKENRRVELRILVSKGLVSSDGLSSDLNTTLAP